MTGFPCDGTPHYTLSAYKVCVQILVVMGLLMRIIHVVPALAGLSVTIVLVPITTVVSRRLSKVRRALIKCTDDRVKLVTEVITGSLLHFPLQSMHCFGDQQGHNRQNQSMAAGLYLVCVTASWCLSDNQVVLRSCHRTSSDSVT